MATELLEQTFVKHCMKKDLAYRERSDNVIEVLLRVELSGRTEITEVFVVDHEFKEPHLISIRVYDVISFPEGCEHRALLLANTLNKMKLCKYTVSSKFRLTLSINVTLNGDPDDEDAHNLLDLAIFELMKVHPLIQRVRWVESDNLARKILSDFENNKRSALQEEIDDMFDDPEDDPQEER